MHWPLAKLFRDLLTSFIMKSQLLYANEIYFHDSKRFYCEFSGGLFQEWKWTLKSFKFSQVILFGKPWILASFCIFNQRNIPLPAIFFVFLSILSCNLAYFRAKINSAHFQVECSVEKTNDWLNLWYRHYDCLMAFKWEISSFSLLQQQLFTSVNLKKIPT